MPRLTDASVKAAKGSDTTRDIYDGGEAGLCLRVQPSGRKAWGLRIRVGGKHRRFDIGGCPATSLAEAGALAAEMKKAANRGADPQGVLRPAPSSVPTVAVSLYI